MKNKEPIVWLSEGHWTLEDFKQRMKNSDWRNILLNRSDTVIFKGIVRQLKAKSLGFGVVEVFKVPKDKA